MSLFESMAVGIMMCTGGYVLLLVLAALVVWMANREDK